MNFWEIFDTSMNFNCCWPPGSKHTRRNMIQTRATVISQETILVFQENENHQWKRTKNVWNRSDSMRERAVGKSLHKIQQRKWNLFWNVNTFHPVLNTAELWSLHRPTGLLHKKYRHLKINSPTSKLTIAACVILCNSNVFKHSVQSILTFPVFMRLLKF